MSRNSDEPAEGMPSNNEEPKIKKKDKSTSKTEKNNAKESKDKRTQKKKKPDPDYKWIVTVAVASFVITIVLSLLSSEVMDRLNSIIIAILVLFLFVFLNVLFDVIGLAFAVCEEKPFHAMSARKIESAKYAIKLIRNAEKVSSFCNDVIGDITGIVSGATASAIAFKLFTSSSNVIGNLVITAIVASATVGLKALGKGIAINHSQKIVNLISVIICFFSKKRKKK